jgi:suppressor for copper-sensitivity B
MKRMFKKLFLIQVFVLIASMLLMTNAQAELSSKASAKSGKAKLELHTQTVAVGNEKDLIIALKFNLEKGWKTYWRSPGTSGFGMKVNWAGSQNIKDSEILWPFPHRIQTILGYVNGYAGDVVFPIRIHLEHPGEAVIARMNVDYLVCDISNCIPQNNELIVIIPAGKATRSASADLIDAALAKVPKSTNGSDYKIIEAKLIPHHDKSPEIRIVLAHLKSTFTPENLPVFFVESNAHLFIDTPSVKIEDNGRKAVYMMTVYRDKYKVPSEVPQINDTGITITYGDENGSFQQSIFLPGPPIGFFTLLAMISIAFIGGLILNFMPCVLPVLSMKVFAFLRKRHANLATVRLDFAATVAGIITSFLIVSMLLMTLRTAGSSVGWGFQFQHPTFLIILIVVLTIFSGNLFGFFEFHLPGYMSKTSSTLMKIEGVVGNFLEGFLVTMLATPCTAPFVGTAIGFAFTQHGFVTVLIFLSMGFGLSFPYLIVAIFPESAHILPKPGPWMIKVKKVMAALLLLTAVWLNLVLIAQVGWLASLSIFVLMGFIMATLAMGSGSNPQTRKLIWGSVGILILFAFLSPPQLPSETKVVTTADKLWHPFQQNAIANLIKENKVVIVDVTADWCITCKTNELLILQQKQVFERLSRSDVVAMKADWTNQDPAITSFLKQFNVYGIPFYVVYGCHTPGGQDLGQILTPAKILTAVEEAKCHVS